MSQDAALTAGVLAGVLLIAVAFYLYNRSDDKIDTGTWVILAVGDSLDFGSYFLMTGQDWLKNAIPFAFAVGSIMTFANAVRKRRFSFPDAPDIFIILIDLLIMVWWLYYGSMTSTEANLAYQFTTVLAFLPMYRSLAKRKLTEKVAPWALWTSAYVLFFLVHALSDGSWEEGVYPVVGMLTHVLVLGFALQTRLELRQLLKF